MTRARQDPDATLLTRLFGALGLASLLRFLVVGVAVSLFSCTHRTPKDEAHRSEGESAAKELSELDPRRPVPLLPLMAWHQKQNMMQHLEVISRIVAGAAESDWAAVAASSKKLEASPSERQRCEHMGAGAEGFTQMAFDFHDRARAIREAAEIADATGVLTATAHTLEACTRCHATYRQDVVSRPSFR